MGGENALYRYGLEESEGVPGSLWYYTRFESETFQLTRPPEPDPNIDPSGNEGESDSLKGEGSGKLTVAPNSESLLPLRIHHHGFYEYSAPAVGVGLWELRDFDPVGDVAPAHYLDSFHFGAWRDVESEYQGFGAKVSDMTLTVEANKNVRIEHDALFLRDTYARQPAEQVANAAWLGRWVLRGHQDETADYRKFKAVTPGGLGVATIVWGKGAAPYGETEYVVVDDWMFVREADDTIVGVGDVPRRDPLQIRPIFEGDLTEGDEWYIYPTSPKPVPVFSSRIKLTGVDLEARFSKNDGSTWQTVDIDSYSLKMMRPREARFGTGSKYAYTIGAPDNAKKAWEISFARTYIDQYFERALVAQKNIQIYAKLTGARIGSTAYEEFAEFELDRSKLTQAGSTTSGAGRLPENPVLRAWSDNGSPLCIERWQNTIASIAP